MSPEFLTQEGFNKLEEELEYLRTVKRKEVAARLHEAAESSLGEFVEDPEFEAAKNEQSFVEGRIRELELILANAQVISTRRKNKGIVEVGSKVVVKEGRRKPEEYLIVGAAEANVKASEASIASARANVVRSQQDYDRMRNIRAEDPGAISERRLQSAEASLAAARAQLNAAEANRDRALQDLGAEGERNSRILQAQAALDQAKLNLERATVRAPEDGVITGLRLDKGNFAAAGAPQLTFIATHTVWVQADFTENNLGHIQPGDETGIVFDALPGEVIRGTVREVSYGVAVDTAEGLIVPVVRDADRKDLIELAAEVADKAERARTRQLNLDELKGGSCTITNIGPLGGVFATPIINQPELAIIGLHAIKERPEVFNGEIAIRKMMYLSVSFDHRYIDGAEAARFMSDLVRLVSNPMLLMARL